jgi:hypothetical protein
MDERREDPPAEYRFPPAVPAGSRGEAEEQEDLRAHPRGRLWQTVAPILQHGPWRRHRAPGER